MSMRGQPAPGDERDDADLRVHAVGAISQVPAAEWDACANPAWNSAVTAEAQRIDQENVYNPFISHGFLSALEESGSVGGRSGWQVQHLIVKTANGAPIATAPCYV